MANNFEGWLLKFGTQEFPLRLIAEETWQSTPNQRLELSAESDNTGKLHRDTAPHTRTKIEFETVDDLTLDEKIEIQTVMNSSVTSTQERKATITYWNDENNSYTEATVYVPDITFKINRIDKDEKQIYYNKIRIALIEY